MIGDGSYSVGFGPTDLFSFVVGSLDTYNTLRLTFDNGTFTDYVGGAIIGGLPFSSGSTTSPTSNGRVTYTVAAGDALITGARFTSTSDSFEFDTLASNGAVPEPATWGIMILGFGAIGGAMRRRRDCNALAFA